MGLARKLGLIIVALGAAGAAMGWFLSVPVRLDAGTLAAMGDGDATRGRRIFFAGGCSSCHAKPKSVGDARLQLPGGLELKTPFGTFVPPNISSDPADGIGGMVEGGFRQRHAARRVAGRPALLSGLSLRFLCAHETG